MRVDLYDSEGFVRTAKALGISRVTLLGMLVFLRGLSRDLIIGTEAIKRICPRRMTTDEFASVMMRCGWIERHVLGFVITRRTLEMLADENAVDCECEEYHPEFEKWWKAYPRKAGKKNAFRSWKRATRFISAEELLSITQVFANSPKGKDKRFCPYPATWLNQERYRDDMSEWNIAGGNSSDSILVEGRRVARWKRLQDGRVIDLATFSAKAIALAEAHPDIPVDRLFGIDEKTKDEIRHIRGEVAQKVH